MGEKLLKRFLSQAAPSAKEQEFELNLDSSSLEGSKALQEIFSHLSAYQQQLLLWFGIFASGQKVPLELTAQVWQVPTEAAAEILESFAQKLLVLKAVDFPLQFIIPAATRTFINRECSSQGSLSVRRGVGGGQSIRSAHSTVLDYYLKRTVDRCQHSIIDDEYFYSSILWHAEQSNQPDILHTLIQEKADSGKSAWLEACSYLSRIDLYIAALEKALDVAAHQLEQNPEEALPLQCCYALTYAALVAQAQRVPTQWFGALLKTQAWRPLQALSYLRLLRDPQQRALAVSAVAPYLESAQLQLLLEVAAEIRSDAAKAEALRGIAPYTPPNLANQVLDAILSISSEYYQSLAFLAIKPRWPVQTVQRALIAVLKIEDEAQKTLVLQSWLPALPHRLLLNTYSAAIALENPAHRAALFILLIRRGFQLRGLLMDTLAEIDDPVDRVQIQAQLMRSNLGIPVDELTVLQAIETDIELTQFLDLHSKYLSRRHFEAVQSLISKVDDEFSYTLGFIALKERWPQHMISKIYSFMMKLRDVDAICLAIERLGHHSEQSLRYMAERAALLEDIDAARIFAALAKHNPIFLPRAIEKIRRIQDARTQINISLSLLSTYSTLAKNVFAIVPTLDSEAIQASIVGQIAPFLSKAELQEAFSLALNMRSRCSQAEALDGLAAFLTRDQIAWGLSQILNHSETDEALENTGKQFTAYSLETSFVPRNDIDLKSAGIASQDATQSARFDFDFQDSMEDILTIAEPLHRARALRSILHQLDVERTTLSRYSQILEVLIAGDGLDFIRSLPLLMPMMLNIGGDTVLGKIALLCSPSQPQFILSSQNKRGTSDKVLFPESPA